MFKFHKTQEYQLKSWIVFYMFWMICFKLVVFFTYNILNQLHFIHAVFFGVLLSTKYYLAMSIATPELDF